MLLQQPRISMLERIPQAEYVNAIRQGANWEAKVWKASLGAAELQRLDEFKERRVYTIEERQQAQVDAVKRHAFTKGMLKSMHKSSWGNLQKAGVTSALGYNFYDLRSPVYFIYPVNVPMRNSIPRTGRVNDGVGTAAHWMATRNPGFAYVGTVEGQRGQTSTPDQNPYVATYKEFSFERAVSFTAQIASEGFTDQQADEHIRGLHVLELGEEGMIWNGNAGNQVGNNGFQLGIAPTPTGTAAATGTNLGGVTTPVAYNGVSAAPNTLPNSVLPYGTVLANTNYVSVGVVLLTAMGYPANNQYGYGYFPTVQGGLTQIANRVNADGTVQAVPGGMSAPSVLSTPTQVTTGNLTLKAVIPSSFLPLKGVFGYAWFVDVETSNTSNVANARLAGITTTPFAYINGSGVGTQVLGSLATGTAADYSANQQDFTGLLGYSASASGTGSYYQDLGANYLLGTATNTSLTSGKDGTVNEIENALLAIFQLYQVVPDEIWGDATAVLCLDKAVRWGGTSPSGYQFVTQRDGQNNLLGGYVVSAYQSRYAVGSPTGGMAIPIRIHPMIPTGTLYFHLKSSPYAQSRITVPCDMLVQRDYYSIEWPPVTRTWTFGTYVHEVLRMITPWIPGVITGIGAFVQN